MNLNHFIVEAHTQIHVWINVLFCSGVVSDSLDIWLAGHNESHHHFLSILQELPGLDGGEVGPGADLLLDQPVAQPEGGGGNRPPVSRLLLERLVQLECDRVRVEAGPARLNSNIPVIFLGDVFCRRKQADNLQVKWRYFPFLLHCLQPSY